MAEETTPKSSATPPHRATVDVNSANEATDEKGGDATSQEGVTAEGPEDHDAKELSETSGNGETVAPAAPESEEVDMKDTEQVADPAGSGPSSAIPANGTPAPSKKASGGSAKKKSSAVPEHKSKKLNKKKSRPLTNLNAQPGEYYFARMKGHPPWPSIICDEEMLPQSLLDTRPVTTKLPDGTYKKPEYADGGKRAYERTFPVMFLHTNEFAWMLNTDLTPLDPKSVSKGSEKGKGKALNLAHEIAAEQHDLNYFKEMLVDHQKAIQEDQEAQAEREAKKSSKAKRKTHDAAQVMEEDDMDLDEDVPEPKPRNKRKKDIDSDGGDEKPAKTPKTATKLKLSTPKTPTSEPTTKAKATKARAKPARKASGSDDEAVDTPKVEQAPLSAAEAKEKKEKMVLFYRHKLQRGFISRDTMPKEDEMKAMSDFLAELEAFPDLEGSIIRATKIHKVLKAMIKLPSIPLDEEYEFRSRSIDLLAKWNDILSNDPHAGPDGQKMDDSKSQAPAKTNGAVKGSKAASKADVRKGGPAEEGSKGASKKKIGTAVEGEEEATKAAEENADKVVDKDSVDERLDTEVKTDEPNIETAPAEEYKPPPGDTEASD